MPRAKQAQGSDRYWHATYSRPGWLPPHHIAFWVSAEDGGQNWITGESFPGAGLGVRCATHHLVCPVNEILHVWSVGMPSVVLTPCQLATQKAVVHGWHLLT